MAEAQAGANGDAGSAAQDSAHGAPQAEAQEEQLLSISVSCRNLSSNSSVIALFEAKQLLAPSGSSEPAPARLLEYVCHTEGLRNTHHPDFATPLRIRHRPGAGQKVKFNVYTLPPGPPRVEEHQRVGSAYVLLDEIAAHMAEGDLMVDVVHGHSAAKDRDNQWLQSHMLIRAKKVLPGEEEDEDDALAGSSLSHKAALSMMTEGRVMTLHSAEAVPKPHLVFYRPDGELGALHWIALDQCDKVPLAPKDDSNDAPAVRYVVPSGFDAEKVKEAAAAAALQRAAARTNRGGGDDDDDDDDDADDDDVDAPPFLRLVDIQALYEGMQTDAFRSSSTSAPLPTQQLDPERCFSILDVFDTTVDLEAASVEEREGYMQGLHGILSRQAARERAKASQFKFLVKLRQLPPEYTARGGGLFVALSSRASNAPGSSMPYELVAKSGWVSTGDTVDLPRAMHAACVSESQTLKFDVWHNSIRPADGLGCAIVDFASCVQRKGSLMLVPLRHLSDEARDDKLRSHKSIMILECMEASAEDRARDQGDRDLAARRRREQQRLAAEETTDREEDDEEESGEVDEEESEESETEQEYQGAKASSAAAVASSAVVLPSLSPAGGLPLIDLSALPPMPRPPSPPAVSVGLFHGYLMDKCAFRSRGQRARRIVFAADDPDFDSTTAMDLSPPMARSASPNPNLRVNTSSSPGPQGTGRTPHPGPGSGVVLSAFGASAANPRAQVVRIAGNDHGASTTSSNGSGSSKGNKRPRHPDRMRLYWSKPSGAAGPPPRKLSSSLRFAEISDIAVGRSGAVLQGLPASTVPDDCAVSIVTSRRTLDLVADSRELRDAFVTDVMHFLLPRSRAFSAWGQTEGTALEGRDWDTFVRQEAEHRWALQRAEEAVRKEIKDRERLARQAAAEAAHAESAAAAAAAAAERGGAASSGLAQAVLSKLSERGMIPPDEGAEDGEDDDEKRLNSSKSSKPDELLQSLAALDDIFSEVDARFAKNALTSPRNQGRAAAAAAAAAEEAKKKQEDEAKAATNDEATKSAEEAKEADSTDAAAAAAAEATAAAEAEALAKEEEALREKRATRLANLASPAPGDSAEDLEDEKTLAEIEARLACAAAKDEKADAALLDSSVPDAPPLPPPAPVLSTEGFIVGDAPPPPPGPPPPPSLGPGAPLTGPAPVRKLKQLHWDPLAQEEVASTIFCDAAAAGDAGVFDLLAGEEGKDIETLFANQQAKKKLDGGASSGKDKDGKTKPVSLLDSKRAYNIEIGLSRLKLGPPSTMVADITRELMELSPDSLTEDKAQILLDRVPTTEELALIKRGMAKTSLAEMGVVEQVLWAMGQVPQVALRLECHLFMLRFDAQAAELKAKLRVLFAACKALSSSPHLKTLLHVVLQVGNHLNAGTSRGNAKGFKLASLAALSNTRSTDGRMTLLDFVAAQMDKRSSDEGKSEAAAGTTMQASQQPPPHESFLADMAPVKEAVNLDWASVAEEQRRMASQLAKIEAELAAPEVVAGAAQGSVHDKFHDRLAAFEPRATEEVRLLSTRVKRVVQLESSLLAYFGEKKAAAAGDGCMSLTTLFSTFSTFTLAYEAAETKARAQAAQAARMAAAKQMQLQQPLVRNKRGSRMTRASIVGAAAAMASKRASITSSAIAGGDGVLDPRLNSASFGALLQETAGQLKAAPGGRRRSMYLSGAYAGRKSITGQTIAPPGAAHGATAATGGLLGQAVPYGAPLHVRTGSTAHARTGSSAHSRRGSLVGGGGAAGAGVTGSAPGAAVVVRSKRISISLARGSIIRGQAVRSPAHAPKSPTGRRRSTILGADAHETKPAPLAAAASSS